MMSGNNPSPASSPSMSMSASLPVAVADNIAALTHAIAVIRDLPTAVYADKPKRYFLSPIGAHFRHVIEHYRAFFEGWHRGLIDYDARPRDSILETEPARAIAAFEELCRQLNKLPHELSGASNLNQAVEIRCCTGAPNPPPVPSCLNRELVFLHAHSIHHFALIAVILRQYDIEVKSVSGEMFGAAFGVAPSTQHHRNAQHNDGQ